MSFNIEPQLPHRPPFLFVRQVVRIDPGKRAECLTRFEPGDPMFGGHFPHNPLVPGVILTEALAQTAGIAAASGFVESERPFFLLSAIRGMKFYAAARPGDEIRLLAEKMAQVGDLWQFQTQANVGEIIVAQGQLVLNQTGESSRLTLE